MRQKTDKKLISFVNMGIIDRLVKDEAELKNCSESSVIEEHLLNSMLPPNPNARFWAENILYAPDGGIGGTLQAIFEEASAGINSHAQYTNLLPIVKWAKSQQVLANTIPSGKEYKRPHCCTQLKCVVERLAHAEKEAEDWIAQHHLREQREFAEFLHDELLNEPQYSRYSNIYHLLISNWELFYDWQITYRLLADLAEMEQGWRNNAKSRTELLQLLADVSAEWDA